RPSAGEETPSLTDAEITPAAEDAAATFPAVETPPAVEEPPAVSSDAKAAEPGNYFLVNFFSKDDWSGLIKRLDPKFAKKVVSKADAIILGEYEIHDIYYKLGDNIDWHDDFNSSRWPAGKSYKNIYSDFYECMINGAASGNSARWPLNIQFSKNNEWVLLALAYKFSGDDKYVKKIADLFKSFKEQNEIGCGINFVSEAASAERLVSWLMCFELVEERHAALFAEIGFHEYFNRQFDHIYERVASRPFENARHERVIALSCLYGVLLQVGGRIAPAVAKLFKKLKDELLFQICPDGGHITGSTALQLAIYKSLLFALVVARKASREGSKFAGAAYDDAEFMDAFARMSRYMAALARPNGEALNIADNYLYFYLPFDESYPLDIKPSLQLASYILMDKKMKYLTGANKIIGIAMIFGNEGIEKYNGLLVEAPEAHASRFDQSGYFAVTSPVNSFAESNAAAHLVFDFGGSPRPKEENEKFDFFRHADLHNIVLSHGGANFISDCGPSFFIKNVEINRYIKEISAHNSVILNKTHFDARSDCRLPESFKRYEDESVCLVSSTHKGYHVAGIDAFVRRTILMVSRDYVLIMDDVFNGRKKPSYADIDVIFHSPPGITIESSMPQLQKNLLIYNSRSSEAKILNLTFSAQKISSAVYRASLSPVFGWHSSSASEVCESTTVVHSARFAKLPVRIYNLFYMANAEDNTGSLIKKLKMNLNKVNSSIEISHRDFKDSIKINDKFEVDFMRSAVKI
ncbi:MAG TPA: heparinase II/III family protein, partial [Candidatus Wallbacteria bacterium]|nr:heparinase II/III family protein [Candidatus Wallbacteria bacterium]